MSDWTPTTEQVRDGYRYDPLDDYYNPVQAGANAERNGRGFDRWLEQVKQEARADAGLLARPLPTRETIARALDQTGAFCGTCSYEPGDFYKNCDDCRRVLDSYADAVLDLLKGQDA